jgi:hypothetical protein
MIRFDDPPSRSREDTHLFLNGGRVCIPDELHPMFLRKMAEAIITQDAWLYVVEKKTNPGRMFMELDLILWDKRLTVDDIRFHLMLPFSKVMRQAYPGRDVHAIVCTAEPTVVGREEIADGGGNARCKIKNGIHVIWPNIVVSPEKAWMLRAWFLYELYTFGVPEIPNEMLCDEWKKVIDPCVFGKNGLRMIWNRKAGTCKVCKGIPFQSWMVEKRKRSRGLRGPQGSVDQTVKRPNVIPCRTCNTFDNKIDEGRPYTIVAIVDDGNGDDDGGMSRLLDDPVLALESTSIRIVPQGRMVVQDLTMSKMTREIIEPWHKKFISDVNRMREGAVPKKSTTKRRVSDGSCSTTLNPVNPGEPAYSIFADYVMDNMHCGVTSIKVDERKHFYLVGTNSRECMNKKGAHDRSTVYLIMMPDGYYQKCWCGSGNVYGIGGVSCLEYRSHLMPYNGTILDIASIRGLFNENFASKFPFTVGAIPSSDIPLCAYNCNHACTIKSDDDNCTVGGVVVDDDGRGVPFKKSDDAPRGSRLIDNYPELRNLSFSEVKEMLEERTKIWLGGASIDLTVEMKM